jgi:hypothetical protein
MMESEPARHLIGFAQLYPLVLGVFLIVAGLNPLGAVIATVVAFGLMKVGLRMWVSLLCCAVGTLLLVLYFGFSVGPLL